MSYTVTGIGSVTSSVIVVPDEYNGLPVTVVFGLLYNTDITEVILGDNVTEIEGMAFYRCTSLESVTLGAALVTIGNEAFSGCVSLTEIVIPESVTVIGERAFSGCTSLASVEIQGNAELRSNAFYNCVQITELILSEEFMEKNNIDVVLLSSFAESSLLTEVKTEEHTYHIHNLVHYEAVESTCSSCGNIEYWYCRRCDIYYTDKYGQCAVSADEIYLSLSDHANTYIVITNEVDAECTTEGSYTETVYCLDCGSVVSSQTVIIPATGHSFNATGWRWSDNYDYAWATLVCDNCGGSVVVGATVTQEEVGSGAYILYTATAIYQGVVYQTSAMVEAAVEHTAGEAVKENYVAATCTSDGSYDLVVYCTDCGEELSREMVKIPATGHSYDTYYWTWYGYNMASITFVCSNDSSHTDTADAPVTSEVTQEATYTESGIITYTVTVTYDGVTYTDTKTAVIPSLQHTSGEAVTENYIAATCTENGSYDLVVYCTDCGIELSRETFTVAATGHSYVFGGWTWTGDEAYAMFVCSVCGDTITVAATVTSEVTRQATCSVEGEITYYAVVTLDGAEYSTTTTSSIPKTEHTAGEAVMESYVAPGCEENGYYVMAVYCEVCGEEISSTMYNLEPTGHNYEISEWIWNGYIAATAFFVCSNDQSHLYQVDAAITDEITVQATYDEAGVRTYTATVEFEGVTYTDYIERAIPALSHTAGEAVIENYVEATCTEAGSYDLVVYCTDCGEELSREAITIAATGHSYQLSEWMWTNTEAAFGYFVCSYDYSHALMVEATVTCTLYRDATCDEAGSATYLAELYYNGVYYVNERVVEIEPTGHDYTDKTENYVEATCTTDGSYDVVVYCTVCGDELSRETVIIPATGHNYEAVVTEPTCAEQGYTTYTCSHCGDSYVDDYTEASGHSWNEGTVVIEVGCIQDGVIRYTCTICNETKLVTIPATGHTEGEAAIENRVEATCTTDGSYDVVVYCTECGMEVSRTTITILATGHSYEAAVTEPTCTERGYTTYTCSHCGESYVADYTDASGHSWNEGVVTTEPTCVTEGVMTYTCTVCGETRTESISVTGHTAGEAVIENKVEATCTTDGLYDLVVYCTVCGEEISRTTITIPATGHTEGEAVTENYVAATCTTSGSYNTVIYCTVCGDEISRTTIAIPATGHTEGEAVTENYVEATCTTDGSYDTVIYCKVCGEELSRETVVIPATGHKTDSYEHDNCYHTYTCTQCGVTIEEEHDFEDGVCSLCGYVADYSLGLKYTLSDDGEYYIVSGIGTCKDTEVVIPSIYKKLPVTEIGGSAFSSCSVKFTSVIIPDSVTTIGSSAFAYCSALLSIDIPDSVTTIGSSAFSSCTALLSIDISNSVTTLNSYAFSSCTALQSVTIGEGVTSIADSVFYGCTALTEIIFNAINEVSLTKSSLLNGVFYNAGSGAEGGITVIIGANVSEVPAYLFYSPKTLNAPHITSVVFEGTLCKSIGAYAFANCIYLTNITIPSSVTSLGNYVFNGCTSLTKIELPSSLESIGTYAFYGCTALAEINIPEKITTLSTYMLCDCTSLATIYFDAECVTSSGSNYFLNVGSELADGTTVIIGAGVTTIYSSCFSMSSSYPHNITRIEFADNSQCITIKSSAFNGCSAEIVWGDNPAITEIGTSAFSGYCGTSLIIPEGITSIGGGAFSQCLYLTEIYYCATTVADTSTDVFAKAGRSGAGITLTIAENVTRIPANLFYNSSSSESSPYITKVIFEGTSSCTEIGEAAFYNLISLESITIPEGVTSIGNSAFYGCTGLETVYFNAAKITSAISSGNNIFYSAGAASGMTLYVGKNVTRIPEYLFDPSNSAVYAPTITEAVFLGDFCTEIGERAFAYCSLLTTITLPDSITSIGDYAFDYSGITAIAIPSGVTSIGSYTFRYCESLESVTLPEGLTNIGSYAFAYCTALASIALPDSLTSIGTYAFRGTSAGIIWGDNPEITEIGGYAFYGYKGASITIPEKVVTIGSYAFYSSTCSIDWGNSSVTSIGTHAFQLSTITSITIPETVTSIGDYAFAYCTNLTAIYYNAVSAAGYTTDVDVFRNIGKNSDSGVTIIIGSSVQCIPAYMFAINDSTYRPNITSVTFEDGSNCTEIGKYAFAYCDSLTSITIPESVVTLNDRAFYNCTALEYIYFNATAMNSLSSNYVFSGAGTANENGVAVIVGKNVTQIPEGLFYDGSNINVISVTFEEGSVCTLIGGNAFLNTPLKSINLPSGLTSIGAGAFSRCTSLESVTLPDTLTAINKNAFTYCTAEIIWSGTPVIEEISDYAFSYYYGTSFSIPDSVTTIGAYAFRYCEYLETLTIGKGVTTFGEHAFEYCTALTAINYNATAADDLSSGTSSVTANNVFCKAGTASDEGITLTIGANVTRIPANLFFPYYSGDYAPKIVTVVFEDGSECTEIGQYAFKYCVYLETVTIPESITSIGYGAFYDCTALTTIYYNAKSAEDLASGYVFDGAATETTGATIYIGSAVTRIPAYLLKGATHNITTVVFTGSDCVSFGKDAFSGCTWITTVDISDLASWSMATFENAYSNPLAYGDLYVDGVVLTELVIPDTVTYISDYAFYNCDKVVSLTISANAETIGSYAFYNCKSLSAITIPDAVTTINSYAFGYCEAASTISIGESVASLGKYAFEYCVGAIIWSENIAIETIGEYAFSLYSGTEITIPESVTCIEQYAVANCPNLTVINYNAVCVSDDDVGSKVFDSTGFGGNGITLNIGAKAERIPASLFATTSTSNGAGVNITELIFASGSVCTEIGASAFNKCATLKSITFGTDIVTIGSNAFYQCTALAEIDIPDSVETIGATAFYGCTSAASLKIGKGVTSIGKNAFSNLANVTQIYYNAVSAENLGYDSVIFGHAGSESGNVVVTIGKDVERIPNLLFYDTYVNKFITEVTFEEGSVCTEIAFDAFYNYTALVTLNLGESLTTIGIQAFDGCTSLAKIVIPDSVKSIGTSAFCNCSSVTSLTIGEGLEEVGSSAFSGLTSLTEINYNATSMTSDIFVLSSAGSGTSGIAVTIGANVERVPNYLFGTSTASANVTSVEFKTDNEGAYKCTYIGVYAFAYSSITTINIPDTISYIGANAFYNCTSLTYYECDDSSYLGNEGNNYLVLVSAGGAETTFTVPNETRVIYDYAFKGCSYTSISLPDSLQHIGYGAFYNCASLESFEIPSTVSSIGDYAFYGCKLLTSIIIPDGVTEIGAYVFYECTKLETVSIPSSVTSIGVYAFGDCRSLTEITLPSAVTSIGDSAFYYCTSLTEITIPDGVTEISDYMFLGCGSLISIAIPSTVKSIGQGAFWDCSFLASIIIPEGVTSIGHNAFWYCTALETIYLPSTLTEIVYGAFDECTSLTGVYLADIDAWFGVTIGGNDGNPLTHAGNLYAYDSATEEYALVTSIVVPEKVTAINAYLFDGCTSLTSVTLHSGVTEIGDYAFRNTGLTSITIPASVTSIGDCAFAGNVLTTITVEEPAEEEAETYYASADGNLYSADKTTLIAYAAASGKTTFTVPDGVTAISAYAFYGCTNLKSVVIPSSVTSIGDYAFYGCAGLTTITFANGLLTIGEYAFYGCSSLTKIELPDSVTSIGSYAFRDCTSLESAWLSSGLTTISSYLFYGCEKLASVTIYPGVTTIGSYAFYGCTSLTDVVIPDGVTYIYEDAFYKCTSLRVVIPASLETIKHFVFSAGITVYYKGTADQFAAIEKGTSELTDAATNVYYYDKDKTATDAGNYWRYEDDEIVAWTVEDTSAE
ncbi:MAG: leucine-rich repeat domain-containing protein [Clostridia bacterium]|nr:leucine-rich repeat domain-containing protein [Clostridia bacterium]